MSGGLRHFALPLGDDGKAWPIFRDLAALPIWCAYRLGKLRPDGRRQKPPVPCIRDGAENAECTGDRWSDPDNLVKLREAITFAEKHQLPGVGLVVRREHGFVIGDLDHAVDRAGNIEAWARSILVQRGQVGAYIETSPSGTGLRFICRGVGSVPENRNNIELFDGTAVKFATVTGDTRKGSLRELVDGQVVVDAALRRAGVTPEVESTEGHQGKPAGAGEKGATASAADGSAAVKAPLKDVSLDTIKSALAALPAENLSYDTWFDVIAAVHHQTEGGDDGLELVDEWSAEDSGRYDPGDLASKWKGLGKPKSGAKAKTIKSLFRLAQATGWRQQPRAAPPFPPVTDGGVEWPEATSLTGKGEPPPRGAIPPTAIPPRLSGFAENGARRSGGDHLAARGLVVPLLGAVIPARISFRPKGAPDYVLPATFYIALAGNIGAGKSPVFAHQSRHVEAIETEHERDYRSAYGRYKRALEAWKAAQKTANKSGVEGEGLPGGEIPEPVPPRPRRRTTSSVTPEGCARLVSRTEDALLVLAEELAGFFGSLDRYSGSGKTGSGDRAFWLKAYDGGSFASHRAAEENNIVVPKLQCSIIGTIQWAILSALRDVLGTDGLLQRFWILNLGDSVMSEEIEADLFGAEVFATVVRLLVDLGRGGEDIVLVASPEAAAVNREAEAWMLVERDKLPKDDVLRGVVAKTTGSVGRLTLALHCLEWAAQQAEDLKIGLTDGIEPLPRTVSGQTARKAFDLWTGYYLPETVRAHRIASTAAVDRDVTDLADFVRSTAAAGGGTFTARDAGQAIRRFRGSDGRPPFDKAAAKLTGAHWVRKGTKAEQWEINPRLPEAA